MLQVESATWGFSMCAEYGADFTSESPVMGIYRQV